MTKAMDLIKDFFLTGSPLEKPVTEADIRPAYFKHKPISHYFPYLDLIDDNKILLDDAESVAAVFDCTPIPTEARSEHYIESLQVSINGLITNCFEEHKVSPWVVSIYSWLEPDDFKTLPDDILAYAKAVHEKRGVSLEPYTEHFINQVFREHIQDMASDGGVFIDPLTERAWGGSTRKVYMVFYRRTAPGIRRRGRMDADKELDAQCKRVSEMLSGCGIKAKRLQAKELHTWLIRWFNPKPKSTQGDRDEFLRRNPWLGNELAEFNLSNLVASPDTRCDKKTQSFYFDGMPHTLLSVERMNRVPKIGELSAEHYESKEDMAGANAKTTCFLDQLPTGSVIIIHYVVQQQSRVRKHIEKISRRSKGDTPEAAKSRETADHARRQIASGIKLYPYSFGIALRAQDDEALEDAILMTDTLLSKNQFSIIDPDYDLVRMDRYLRFLPCAYDPALDQVGIRQRLIYTNHLASLLPFYGRSRGTGNHCIEAFNRGGESLSFDPLKQGDRSKNGHLFFFGPTGAGKSSSLVYLQLLITAIYNPRWVVVEAGNSFGLLTQYLKAHGKSTVDIVLRQGKAPSIAPYKSALELVDAEGNPLVNDTSIEDILNGDEDIHVDPSDNESSAVESAEESRDILGELLIVARLMVTGGEPKEEARISRADMGLLKKAILLAASNARKSGKDDVLTEDVLNALRTLSGGKESAYQLGVDYMCSAMELFTDGFAGELFNRPGQTLPDADYIRIDMGSLAHGDDNNDKLCVAYISIINQVISRAQRTQNDGRPTINLTDEAHMLTCNPLLAKYIIVVSKLLGRRMGLWLWQATQNMDDYKGDAQKMLAMFEWWMCLFVDEGEVKKIEEVKKINDDQRQMLLCTRKEPGKYTEGVVMSDNVQALFRMIPPGLAMALGQTDPEEKNARAKLMDQYGVDEMAAAEMIGRQIADSRKQGATFSC